MVEFGQAKPSVVLDAWKQQLSKCVTVAQVQLLYHMLDDCIRWDLSADAAASNQVGE